MKKLLVAAYAISPIRGSEKALGWEISRRLGKYFKVTVLMCETTPAGHPFFSEVCDFTNKNGLIHNVQFVPVPIPANAKKYFKLHDKGFWPAYYWGYNLWQKEAFKVVKDLHKLENFDATYLLNMTGFREPGYLWKLDIPFFWGPINGFHSIPFSFIRSFGAKEMLLQTIKHMANETQIKFTPRAREAARKAQLVWCVDQKALSIARRWGGNAELLQETGLNPMPEDKRIVKYYDGKRSLNIVWSGLMITRKALGILIDALLQTENLNFHLTIVGNGPQEKVLKELATPINDKISWLGWVTQDEATRQVMDSDLLIHTSLSEGTPHTVLEAIGLGVPVVCHDVCGMAHVVDDRNGFKIPYQNAKTSSTFINKLLREIQERPGILNSRFKSVWQTTDQLSWDKKVDIIATQIEQNLFPDKEENDFTKQSSQCKTFV